MTPDPTHDDPTQGEPSERLPPESRAARSLTDHAKAEEHPAEAAHADALPEYKPRIWPRVVGVLILLLGVAGAWIWQNPGFIHDTMGSLFPASTSQDNDAAMLKALEVRVARLEQRPVPVDLTPRVEALEQRAPATGQVPAAAAPVDLRPLLARLDALETRGRQAPELTSPPGTAPSVDLHPLLARLDALEKNAAEQSLDAGKVDALAGKVAALADRDPAAALRGTLDDLNRQLQDVSVNEAKVAENSAHTMRLARLDAAAIALASGHGLGAIPDAPPALARFASTAPPTLAELRLAFPPASEAALRVSQPDTEGKPFLDRVMARLQDFKLITVREGSHVVIGNSAAATLAHAQMLLDAGDLGGAVRTVATLTGPPAEKMAAWLADATALQAAREALASLAEQG
jgi:hypothetical protein